jgi:hypothetical protein
LLSENLLLIPSGNIKKAYASELAEFVSEAWKKMAGKTVEQSFRKCRITNLLHGKEKDIVTCISDYRRDLD